MSILNATQDRERRDENRDANASSLMLARHDLFCYTTFPYHKISTD